MKRTVVRAALLVSAVLFVAGAAGGTTISYPSGSCDVMGCQGSALGLSVDAGSAVGTWEVFLTIDTTHYTGSLPGIGQIGFGAIQDWSKVSLVSAPGGAWGAPVASSLNSIPCVDDQNNQHKVCVAGYVDVVANPGAYTWNLLVTGGTVLETGSWHIGAQYQNAAGTSNGNLISTEGVVPEPSSALVFAVGLGVVSTALRRRGGA